MQIITKAQADFIETFNGNEIKAVHYVSRWGWGHFLTDGQGHEYESEDIKPFSIDDKLEIINAIINGYEVKKEEWVLATEVYVNDKRTTVYYQGTVFIPSDDAKDAYKFNSKEEAKDAQALMKLNKEYFPQPIND